MALVFHPPLHPFFRFTSAAADKYGLARLRSMCESSLEKNFAVDTIAHTLVLSHLHSAKGLKVSGVLLHRSSL